MFAGKRCPDTQSYARLASGQLSEEDKEALLAHLEVCAECSMHACEPLGMDTLVDLVRQARKAAVPQNAVADLIARLSQLRPDVPGLPAGEFAKEMLPPTLVLQTEEASAQELCDFLAPPQTGEELGYLGSYRILKVLGSGGMGIVFLAEDTHLMRRVALKAMRPTLAVSDSARRRFLREARAAAALHHDHIVSVYQCGDERGIPFLTMELLQGESLEERVQREGKLTVAEVLRIGRQIALGLNAAHQCGLIHRDIKPANVWLEAETERVKLLDFGLARAVSEGSRITQWGAIVGTPAYMAPEQSQGQDVDFRCDLFSLGCILYRLCTGQEAFQGDDPISTLMSVNTHAPPSPHQVDAALPLPLSRLIMALLAKDRKERPSSASAVAAELERIGRDPTPTSQPKARKRRWRTAVGMALLLALIALGALAVLRWKADDGTIVLEDLPADAKVIVDGSTATVRLGEDGKSFEVRIAPGKRKLSIKAAGFEMRTEDVTLIAGERKAIHLRLEPVKTAIATPPIKVDREPSFFDGGDWRLENGELVQAKAGRGLLMFGDRNWTDYDISFETKTLSGAKDAQGGSLLFRVQSPRDYLSFCPGAYGGTWHETIRIENGKWMRDVAPLKMAYKTDHWYKVLVRVRGSDVRCRLDDKELFHFKDAHFAQGQIGLGTWNSVVRWKNLKVIAENGRVLWEGFPILPTRADSEADIPKPQSKTGDALRPGSVWAGKRAYKKGWYAVSSVSYFLCIDQRDGVHFKGHIFDNGWGRNPADVNGEIQADSVIWRERQGWLPHLHKIVRGRLEGNAIRFTFEGKRREGGTFMEGDGELTLRK